MPHISSGQSQWSRQSKSVHTVDWTTLRQIRTQLQKHDAVEPCEDKTTPEDLTRSWLQVAEDELHSWGCDPLSSRDKEFIEIRVSQSMREEAILVGLQHAFEVACPVEIPDTTSMDTQLLPFSEVVGIFGRKLWHLRPGLKDSPTKRKTDFSYKTPDEFIRNTVRAMELDGSNKVTPSDFLVFCLGRKEWDVTLHFYDLSRGVVALLSPWLIREQLEGVWHTGLVVYGKEYYFGGDIFYDTPGATGFGTPRMSVHLGTTLRQRDELHSFIVEELKPIFTRDAYDAARNNCNHFTDRVSMYLVGKHIPEDVLLQPEIMMRTRLGRMLRPILTRVLGQYFEPKGSAEEICMLGPEGQVCKDRAEVQKWLTQKDLTGTMVQL
eukprot:CAMPEP_0179370752 /NCGR_PEP_ID=MMETSP0797-20121207/85356_1 /TAXON_ID=47934 /ORGANISM="Dinophysis acuminata, Strain DAEP01" /LENGTH=378 /DNA_ID=CAMNT_0021086551 /DNA_START=143 /DNA_END=1279 /DNA_ORIENTATION=+